MDKNYLNDVDFLKQLDLHRNKIIYAKIISLTIDELPREEITGQVVSGTINVDGASAVRRTCSLNLIANNINLNSFYWGLNTKFKLYIGVENIINSKYPDIIWFPQGVYVITKFSSSQNINSYSISISGKDKMCLLNGDLGGSLTAISTVFDCEKEELADGSYLSKKIPIKTILYKLVSQLGGEKISNIIINDLDDYGLELLDYTADIPLYLIIDDNNEVYQAYIDDTIEVYPKGSSDLIQLKELRDDNFTFNPLSPISTENPTYITFPLDAEKKEYTIAKKEINEAVGYKLTDIVYAGDLVGVAGDSLVTILDKIKKQLGDFEYFYDVYGNFIFQRAKTYITVSWNNIQKDEYNSSKYFYVEPNVYSTPLSYNFEGNQLITSMSNAPNLLNIKNDYIIWGSKKTSSGIEVPIHMRYAIDKKPKSYTTYNNVTITTEHYDWRELIYQMAIDYFENNHKDDFLSKIQTNNNFPLGITGYESYYMDMQGFWRELYNPKPEEEDAHKFYSSGSNKYWNKNIDEDPSLLNFWIDFLDTDGDLSKFSVQSIGRRQKVINDNDVKSIYFKNVPLAIFYSDSADRNKKEGYAYFQIGQQMDQFFDLSVQGKSAQEELNTLLYQHTCAQETITLSVIPVYYLEPNTRIFIKDDKNLDINNEYIITRFSIPLSHNGTMNITATKVIQQII